MKYCLISVIITSARNDLKVTDYTIFFFGGGYGILLVLFIDGLCSAVDPRKRYKIDWNKQM